MDDTEKRVIDELFGKIRQAEAGSGPRDPQAEAHIRTQLAAQPASPYYMAQAIIIQEQALAAARSKIEQLEQQRAEKPSGGFLGGLFGGGSPQRPTVPSSTAGWDPRLAPYTDPRRQGRMGSGFLGGAMQTALGVAGGVLIGNVIADMFTSDAAAAAPSPWGEPAADEAPEDLDVGGMDEEF